MNADAAPRWSRDALAHVAILTAIAVAAVLVACSRQPATVINSSTRSGVVHLSGTIKAGSEVTPFELWYDLEGERFEYRAGADDETRVVAESGRLCDVDAVEITSDGCESREFDDSTLQVLTPFAYALHPDTRSYFAKGEPLTFDGESYATIKDRIHRTFLLRDDELPVMIRNDEPPASQLMPVTEIRYQYDVVEEVAAASVPPDTFVAEDLEAARPVPASFQYMFGDEANFNRVLEFEDFDLYWLGPTYKDWECFFVHRHAYEQSLGPETTGFTGPPGAIVDSVSFMYTDSPAHDGGNALSVNTSPLSSLRLDPAADPRKTPIAVGGEPAYLLPLDEGGILTLGRPGVEVTIGGPDIHEVVEAAEHLVLVQSRAP